MPQWPTEDYLDRVAPAIANWLLSGRVGISSRTIACATLGANDDLLGGSYPSDPSDYNRCALLLEAIPQCANGLRRLGEIGCPEWRALVRDWEAIRVSFIEEVGRDWSFAQSAPKTYALMKEIIAGANGPIDPVPSPDTEHKNGE